MCGPNGIWQIHLFLSHDGLIWTLANDGLPLSQLQRHPGGMYGGPSLATVNGRLTPKNPRDGLYHLWFHATTNHTGNLPTDIYHASSPDLIDWSVASPATPVLEHQGRGFSFDQVADPSVVMVDGKEPLMYYDGDNNRVGGAAIGLAVPSSSSSEHDYRYIVA